MSAGTRLHDLEFKLMTVNLLRIAKKRYKYRDLSEKTNLPIAVLSRYVRGHVLPTLERANELWSILTKIVSLEREISERIKFDEYGYFDNTSVIFDTALLQRATQYVLQEFAGKRITKVLTAAVDGIPLATTVANVLRVDLVVAKKEKEVGVHGFLEETYIPSNSAVRMSLFIPKGSIKKNDSVLIVDDVIRSGETQRALMGLVEKAKATVAGIFALILVGDEWKKNVKPRCPFVVIHKVNPPVRTT